jgi:micrococcal nuclease
VIERSRPDSIGIVVLVACVLLAGCSGGGSPGTPTTATGNDTTAPVSPSPTATEEATSSDDRTTVGTGTRTGTTETTEAEETTDTVTEDGTTPPARGTARTALVTRVVDGDTIEIRYPNGTADTVRLLGVDTPETAGEVSPEEFEGIPDTEAGRTHLREWAERADGFAREELSGRRVQVVTDPEADRRGRYGRLLAYVVRSGENRTGGGGDASEGEASESSGEDGSFNAALLREGYARVYDSSFSERERYDAIEARARERNIGLWGFDGEESTEEPSSGLAVARIQADARWQYDGPAPSPDRSDAAR